MAKSKQESLIFTKENYGDLNSNILEKAFMKTMDLCCGNIDIHMELIEDEIGDYLVYPLFLYRHGCFVFEGFRRCRFDSAMMGCIAIKNGSDKTFEDVVNELYENIEEVL